jgi:alpha-ketoglutarate-dependent taurine dioxygenase
MEPETRYERTFDTLARWIVREHAALKNRQWEYGAVLLRGFDLRGPAQFASIARLLVPDLAQYRGGDALRDRVGTSIYTSTSLSQHCRIPPHNEKSYSNDHPTTVLFYCNHPPSHGGETPLVDGRVLLSKLQRELVETFQCRKVRYIQNLPDRHGIGKSWQETFESSDRSEVEQILRNQRATFWWSPEGTLHIEELVNPIIDHPWTGAKAFFSQADRWHVSSLDDETRAALLSRMDEFELYHSCTFGDGSQIQVEFLDQIRSLRQAAAVRFPWQEGDLLIVDNLLTLHGREPYHGNRKILVAMG